MKLRARLAAALVAAALAGCHPSSGPGHMPAGSEHAVGGLRVSVAPEPEQPRLGDNRLRIQVLDADSHPVAHASLQAVATMEAMGTMPRMENRAEVRELEPGVYEADYKLNMMGEWDLGVDIRAPQVPPHHLAYRLSTSVKGVDFAGGTPGDESAASPESASGGAAVPVDATLRQTIDLRTAPVTRGDLRLEMRMPARVGFDESRMVDISPKYAGWVREMRADYAGRPVRAGEVLFTVYSPELLTAQQDYLGAIRVANADSARPEARELVAAAHRRLRLLDMTAGQIESLSRTGLALESVPVLSPVSGVVEDKEIVAGSAFASGQKLLRLAPDSPVWVNVSLYEWQLPLVHAGMQARVRIPGSAAAPAEGRVTFISPTLALDTRTADARIELPNPRGELRPGMFLEAELSTILKNRIQVPVSAVIYSGARRVVFVDLGDGRLAPREVKLGQKSEDDFEVLDGLRPGEQVVVRGNFLVAAESRMKSALERWDAGK